MLLVSSISGSMYVYMCDWLMLKMWCFLEHGVEHYCEEKQTRYGVENSDADVVDEKRWSIQNINEEEKQR